MPPANNPAAGKPSREERFAAWNKQLDEMERTLKDAPADLTDPLPDEPKAKIKPGP